MRYPARKMVMILLAVAAVSLWASAAAARPGFYEVVLEGGASEPQGDLGDGFDTPAGFDADTGYEVGFRVRSRWPNGWAVAPAFHYVHFGKHTGWIDETLSFEGGASIFEYGVDFQYFFPTRRNQPQFYLTAGAALTHNRYREEYSDGTWFEEGSNTLGASAGIGLKVGDLEFSALYHLNRFDTQVFFPGVDDYNWDWFSVRVGVALPRMR